MTLLRGFLDAEKYTLVAVLADNTVMHRFERARIAQSV
jgi:hypothetical protein